MTVLTGRCLCGARAYEIDGEIDGVWVCHCSLCRKASGSVGNAILIVPVSRFRWTRGKDHAVILCAGSSAQVRSGVSQIEAVATSLKSVLASGRQNGQGIQGQTASPHGLGLHPAHPYSSDKRHLARNTGH